MDEMVYTLRDIQRILKVSHCTALRIFHSEGFPKLEGVGRRLLTPASAFNAWIDQHTVYDEVVRPFVETTQPLQAAIQPYVETIEALERAFQLKENERGMNNE